jgi:hypothetical protein
MSYIGTTGNTTFLCLDALEAWMEGREEEEREREIRTFLVHEWEDGCSQDCSLRGAGHSAP